MKYSAVKEWYVNNCSEMTVKQIMQERSVSRDAVTGCLRRYNLKCKDYPVEEQLETINPKYIKPDLTRNPNNSKVKKSYKGMKLVYIGLGTLQTYVPDNSTNEEIEEKKAERRLFYQTNHSLYRPKTETEDIIEVLQSVM